MTIGIVGRKSGMTRVFTEAGVSIPVSVVEVSPNRITQVKRQESDGYSAVQVTVGNRRASRVVKPAAGHFAKANSEAGYSVVELRNDANEEFEVGGELTASVFEEGQYIDVTGISKGKGFAGAVKRWNFRMQDATHGNSLSHRAPGSSGQCQTPGRVMKGKKMAGHMGAERVTVQNLQVVKVDADRNLILVKGAIPGAPGGEIVIRPAVKMRNRKTVSANA